MKPGQAETFVPIFAGRIRGHIVLAATCGSRAPSDHAGPDSSPRNFARVFARSAGITPARYVEKLRVEGARRRLEESRSTVDEVAAQCGFGTRESMRRSFQQTLRVSPTAYRSRFANEGRAT